MHTYREVERFSYFMPYRNHIVVDKLLDTNKRVEGCLIYYNGKGYAEVYGFQEKESL